MAKKIQIDIEVNGKMQKATVSAKKLNDALSQTGKSAREADRNVKGAAQASSNASKNFSKMSQGMGGLVGAYASLAASLFAVSAAFNFLKGAGELKSLQAGQVAYASATGVALKSLTNNIIEATNAQISFKDAAQASAIGTAAGLSADQMERLGKAANDASQILGRDVTDSFNRLVRGVTKAEPELLDELGIILRLENATEQYASALGKSANDLTAFERSQAVANDVLAQSEDKYSRILDIVGRSPNQYAQLGKAFDDLVMKIQRLTDVVAGPLAKVLQDTPALAIASFLLLLKGPLAALGVNFQEIAEGARKSADKQISALKDVETQAKLATTNVATLRTEFQNAAGAASKINTGSKVLERAGKGTMTGTDKANLTKALASAEAQYKKHGKIVSGIFKGMSMEMVNSVNAAFTQMNLAEANKVSRTKVATTQMTLMYTRVAAAIKVGAAALATWGTRLLSMLGWIGIAVTAFQVIKDLFFDTSDALNKQEESYRKNRESLIELNKELENFVDVQRVIAEGTQSAAGYGAIASVLGNRTPAQLGQDIDLLVTARDQFQRMQQAQQRLDQLQARTAGALPGEARKLSREIGKVEKQIEKLNLSEDQEAAKDFFDTIQRGMNMMKEETGRSFRSFDRLSEMLKNPASYGKSEILQAISNVRELGAAINESSRISKEAEDSLRNLINSISPDNQATQTIKKLTDRIENLQRISEESVNAPPKFTTKGFLDDMYKGATTPKFQFIPGVDATPGRSAPAEPMIFRSPEAQEADKLIQKLEVVKAFRAAAHKTAKAQLETQKELTNEVVGELSGTRALREANNAVAQNLSNRQILLQQIADIEVTVAKLQGETLTQDQKDQLEILRLRLGVEENLQTILEARAALAEDMEPILNAQERLRLEQEVLQVAQQVNRLDQKRLDLAQRRRDIQGRLVELRTEMEEIDREKTFFGRLFGDLGKAERLLKAQIAREQTLLNQKKASAEKELDLKFKQIDAEYDLLAMQFMLIEQRMKAIALETEDPALSQQATEAAQTAATMAADASATGPDSMRGMEKAAAMEEMNLEILEMEGNIARLMNQLADMQPIQQAIRQTGQIFQDNFVQAFDDIVTGSKSAKTAFKDMAKQILRDIARMISRLMVQYMLMQLMNMIMPGSSVAGSAGGGFSTSATQAVGPTLAGGGGHDGIMDMIDSMPGGRYGGVMKPPAGYRSGGIADGPSAGYPAMLHGREAVVPLPHGDKIPVELRGGGSQQNNVGVTVNINRDGSSETSTDSDGQNGEKLGNLIAATVRKELLNEKRAGGLLSAYGV